MIKVEDRLARFYALSDGIFAVIITVMVVAFKPPTGHDFRALIGLWPDLISYALSYAFIAVVWLNHHALLRPAQHLTGTLALANFGHLFAVHFIPFITVWLAEVNGNFSADVLSAGLSYGGGHSYDPDVEQLLSPAE